jgi:hypothetical protein
MLAGVVIFDVVTPRLIPASSLDIIMQAARSVTDASRVMVLEQLEPFSTRHGWLHVQHVATYLPPRPFVTWTFEEPDAVLPPQGSQVPELLFWSPAVEEDALASQAICARWPAAALYVLDDRAGLSRAFAARPSGPHWRPALPDSQWTAGTCQDLAGRLHARY